MRNGNEGQKTHIGGVLTLLCKGILIYFLLSYGRKLVFRVNPYISSQEVGVGHLEITKNISDMNQIHYAVLDHKDNYYSLEEIKPDLNIQVIHQLKTYDSNGKEKKKNNGKEREISNYQI